MKKTAKNRGVAMIIVTCVLAVVTALCLSLVYGAAQISANAEKRHDQIRAHQLSCSISDTIRDALLSDDGTQDSLKGFVQDFLTWKTVYAYLYDYTATLDQDSCPEGCKSVKVSFRKSNIDVPDVLPEQLATGQTYWINKNDNKGFGFLDITVTVETEHTVDSVTYHYDCRPDYDTLHYYYTSQGHEVPIGLDYRDDYFYLQGTDNRLTFTVPDDGGEEGDTKSQDVDTSSVNMNNGVVEESSGSEQIQLHCGFQGRVLYKILWDGEIR